MPRTIIRRAFYFQFQTLNTTFYYHENNYQYSRRAGGSHGTFDARAIRGFGRNDHSEQIANNT